MKLRSIIFISLIMTGLIAYLSTAFLTPEQHRRKPTTLSAGRALADWHAQRSYPAGKIAMAPYTAAWENKLRPELRMAMYPGQWQAIGPKNFGGRTLTLCFNPLNTNTIYAGSASGGLWRSFSFADGPTAWHRVPTGFPVLGVATIAIHPADTNVMYVGTGEVYNDQSAGTGFGVRTNRGTYGIGILKTTDGGQSWNKSLDWAYSDLRGVQEIIINPVNPSTLFAATTEGTYRSFDDGATWNLIHPVRMATDLLMVPGDTSILFIAAGNSFSANPGIYRSADGGNTFTQITVGLPFNYSGKAMLDICRDSTQIMYASIADQLAGHGLFKSINQGLSWVNVNTTDIQSYQGWYSHDVSVDPGDANEVLMAGVDVYKSIDAGVTLNQVSYWYNWDFNDTTVGGNEGPADYVHADVHKMVRHPNDDDIIFLATDGGIFKSVDSGISWVGRNGGYQTQQFYANFSCSSSDSLFAIGGMQDNATAVYEGNAGWRRVIGGDGVSTAIDPNNDQVVFGSSQYLSLQRSNDGAVNFTYVAPPAGGSTTTAFAGPFAMSKSWPSTLYGGRKKIYKSTNSGNTWTATNSNNELDGNPALVLETSYTNPDLVYAATAPVVVPQPGLFKTTNGGNTWTNITAGLPNRYLMDIAIDPFNDQKAYVAVGGFGTPHLYRTTNSGTTWTAWGNGLPDVPTNTITIDPLNAQVIYLGNDLGVYASIDGGQNWALFNEGIDDAVLVMDISVSPSNRKLRLATHGLGVYERDMIDTTTSLSANQISSFSITPNPATTQFNLHLENHTAEVMLEVYNLKGQKVLSQKARHNEVIHIHHLNTGSYIAVIRSEGQTRAARFVKL